MSGWGEDLENRPDFGFLEYAHQLTSVKLWKRRCGELHAELYKNLPIEQVSGLGLRPAVFWWYEEGVPGSLRGSGRAQDIEDDALALRRVKWLLGAGQSHLREGEAKAIREKFGEVL